MHCARTEGFYGYYVGARLAQEADNSPIYCRLQIGAKDPEAARALATAFLGKDWLVRGLRCVSSNDAHSLRLRPDEVRDITF